MKQVDGIIITKDMERLSQAFEVKGFINDLDRHRLQPCRHTKET